MKSYTFYFALIMMNIFQSISLFSSEKKFDAIVNQALEEFHVPGAAVAVVSGDKILLCRGYGMRDVENELPVTENTLFSIASNTKAFTSFILGQLVDEGKVALDDPVLKYIPEFRMFNEELTTKITVRDLIAHRTGIPRNDALWVIARDLSEEDVLQALPYFPPICGLRETFQYNNLMYVVAGKVISNVTKQSYEHELTNRLIKPLGMDHTGLTPLQQLEGLDISYPHIEVCDKIQKLPFSYPSSTIPGSGIHSSVSDIAKWVQVHLSNGKYPGLIQQETLEDMHTIHMPFASNARLGLIHMPESPAEPSGYGLGWEIDSFRGRKHVHHGGTIEGFFSEISFLPEEKIAIVILTNSSTDGLYAISSIRNRIYDHLLGIQGTPWLEKIKEKWLETKKPSSLKKYIGTYRHPAYGELKISLEYDMLFATFGKGKLELKEKEEGVFEGKFPVLLSWGVNPVVEFSFITNSLGEVEEIHAPFEHFRAHPPIIFRK